MKTKIHLTLMMLLLSAVNAAATPARIFIEDFSIQAGESKQILIDLENPNDNITLVEFDMFLPTGLSIASGEDAVDIAGRTTWKKHSLETANKNGGKHFLLYSSSNALLTGTSGAIISVMLTAGNNFSGGDIKLQNILLVTPEQGETKPETYLYTISVEGDAPITNITLSASSKELTIGQVFQLSATVSPSNATNKSIKWSSDNNSVVTVNNNGLVTAVAPGNAVITCEAQDGSGVNATCNITVKAAVVGSNIQFADAETKRICIENWDTNGDGELSLDEAAVVESIEQGWGSAFSGNRKIESFDELIYFTKLTEIPGYAFYDCTFLKSISFPESVTTINSWAFCNCSSLTNLQLPNGLETLYDDAFENCDALTSITIPKYVYAAENLVFCSGSFSNCNNLTEINVAPENPYLESIDNVLYLKNHKEIYQYPAGKRDESYTILDGVRGLFGGVFSGCRYLKRIIIPESVKYINGGVFQDCDALKVLELPSSLETFDGYHHILGCTGLEKVVSHIANPQSIDDRAFEVEDGVFTSATLYVPKGTKNLYMAADGWNRFNRIEEIRINTLSVPNLQASIGNTFTLPISMTNEDEITAMQFELSLPDGVSVAGATLTDRKDGHSIDYSQLANGNYQFTVFSGSSKALKGNGGDVANISLSISNSLAAGKYPIQVKYIELTTTAGDAIYQEDISSTLSVSNIMLGDVNCDNKITITDAVGIVNHILGNASSNFHPEAADVNGDGGISITDAVRVVNIILNQGSSVKERRTREVETEREPQ